MRIVRCDKNPIVTPGLFAWRKATVFNPAAIVHEGKFYLFERAAGSLRPWLCHIGLLASDDGVRFSHVVDKPVFTPEMMGWPQGSVQDPRVVKLDDTFYMVYAVRPYAIHVGQRPGFDIKEYYPELKDGTVSNRTRSAIAVSKDLVHWEHLDFCTPEAVDDRDVILFPEKIGGRYALLRRPQGGVYTGKPPSIYISYSTDLKDWSEPELLAAPKFKWEGAKIGGSTPPIRTESGWLFLYHGVDKDVVYRVGAMLLDPDDPRKVLARTRIAIMEPTDDYERVGSPYIGNVVFPCGAVVNDGILHIYYGCCDYTIGLATVPVVELVEFLLMGGNEE